ncbi:hypothetical protein HYV84_00010 [Candidatus Woesearchaeota archaeon]|nr:hypothetical protein [Candidatus Woesearchaeota archaeon]
MIGGGALCLKNLKDATVDMDMVVLSKEEFDILSDGIAKLGYSPADKELLKEAVYKNAVVVFEKGESRIDIFIKTIVGMLDFSERMAKRAELYAVKGKLAVQLCSNVDIFLLKSLSDRVKDIPDIERLLREGIDWKIILEETDLQKREGVRWIFFVYEQLCRVENTLGIKVEGKQRIFRKCVEYWAEKPSDFMVDIANTERHIPKKYLRDIKKQA